MSLLRRLFQQTFIYGLATVLPRVLSVLLLPLYTEVFENADGYGEYTKIYAWIAIFNVLLAYGMETAFFRFYLKEKTKFSVIATSLISLLCSTVLFGMFALLFKETVAGFTGIKVEYIEFTIFILALDALAIIPFALFRAKERPMRYAVLKLINVGINLGFNLFFLLLLPRLAQDDQGFFSRLYQPDFEIPYIFISNIIASGVTLLLVCPVYFRVRYVFDRELWRRMMRYAIPVMFAGIAFTINEVLDKILVAEMVSEAEAGKYAACYKLALFMTLYGTAFRLGVEPFFFSHSNAKTPEKTYATITTYFVILGSFILLAVVVFADLLKLLFVRNEVYWEAMKVVPIILLASFCLGVYHNLSVWYKVTDRTRYGAYISSIGAVVTLVINFVFIPTMGYMASAIATLMAYATMMGLSYYFGKKYYPIPYNLRKITFYGGISILFSILSFYVFNRNLISGTLLLFVFLGLIYKLEGDKLKRIFLKSES